MKRLLFLTSIFSMILIACVTTKPAQLTVCQDVQGPSLLEQYIPDLRLADGLFKIALLEVGRLDSVKQKDVAKVLDESSALIDHGASYSDLINYLLPKFKAIREKAGPELIIVGEYFITFQDVKTPITAKDACYLKAHIASQKAKILPWIS